MENENLYDKLREIQSDGNHTINILQESIDVALQMSYFKLTTRIKKSIEPNVDYLSDVVQLYDPDVELATKKRLLCILASIDDPKYFRAIETFKKNAPDNLKEWSTLALQESKMLLESSLLDTKLLYISTGLGGKGEALRFFIVLVNKKNIAYDDSQAQIIEKELDFHFRRQNGEIEEIKFDGQYAQITCLLPLECNIGDVVKNVIKECNTYGGFIEEDFLLTNVKKLSTEEINQFLDDSVKNRKQQIKNFDLSSDIDDNQED